MPDASVELGLNADPMYRELQTAEGRFGQSMGRMAGSSNRAAGAQENLLRSNHRVATQIHNFSKDLLSGGSAADVFATGLEGIGRSLNLSLGALAGIGIGAAVVTAVGKALDHARELRKEISKLGTDSNTEARFETLNELETRLTKIKEKLEEFKKPGFLEGIANFFKGLNPASALAGPAGLTLNMLHETERLKGEGRTEAEKVLGKTQQDIAAKARQQNEVEALRATDPEAAKKLELYNKAAEEGAAARKDKNADLELEIGRQLELALDALDRALHKTQIGRVTATLGELTSIPDVVPNGVSFEKYQAGQKARKIQSLEAEAEQYRQSLEPGIAAQKLSQADELRKSLGFLNPKEQELTGAINASELPGLLRDIADKVTFKNQ